MYHIQFISLLYDLFIDIKHVNITWTDNVRVWDKFEKMKFTIYFLNKDISVDISSTCLKFSTHVDKNTFGGKHVSDFSFKF